MEETGKDQDRLVEELDDLRRQVAGLTADNERLRQTAEALTEREWLVAAFHEIGRLLLTSLDLDEILDNLSRQIIQAGIFRSLMVALVRQELGIVEVVRNYVCITGGFNGGQVTPGRSIQVCDRVVLAGRGGQVVTDRKVTGTTYPLDSDNITAEVARTGELRVIRGWSRQFDENAGKPQDRQGKTAFFIPVKQGERVLAVLATGCQEEETEEVRQRIAAMEPLLGMIAIALDHALLYEQLEGEMIGHRQAGEELQKVKDDLELRVAERTTELRLTNEQLQQEVAEHRRTEAALRESEEILRQVAENIQQIFWVEMADNSKILYMSPVYEKVWGRSCASLYADPRSWFENVVEEDREKLLADLARRRDEDYDYSPDYPDYRIVRPDGTRRWIHARVFPIRDRQGEVYRRVGVAEDITERKQLEEQLRQVQKMQAVGQLTAGIAHNFNNMLMAILCNLEEAQFRSAGDASLLQEAQATALRASEMIDQLLVFSRTRETANFKRIQPGEILRKTVGICRRTFDRKIVLHEQFPTVLPAVSGDATQLEQVFLNVLLNARDALKEGATEAPCIRIAAQGVDLVPDRAGIASRPATGPHLRIEIADNGVGMTEEVRQRIFEPFFTTKEVGQGTGLGLATVYAILQEHGGWIECASQPGAGSTFSLFLPVAAGGAGTGAGEEARGGDYRGQEQVLVVEDEEMVRRRLVGMLERHGYRVLAAATGREGVECFAREGKGIDLVLLDLSLPEMSGKEVLARLRQQDPGVRVVVSTGDAGQRVGQLGVEALLKKPYRMTQAMQTIRQVLDAPPGQESGGLQ